MIKACIIGISGYGATHYNDLLREQEAGRSKLFAATVINQEEEKGKCAKLREIGCEIFTDHRKMLRKYGKMCNVCFIPTGINLHTPMTIDALRAGCNVFVEKPLAVTVQDIRKIKDEASKNDRFVAVGYQHIYTEYIKLLKNTILENKLGRILSISGMSLWPRNSKYYFRNNWAGKLKVGKDWVLDSPFNNANAHILNVMLFLAGGRFEKSAVPETIKAELYRANNIESADTASMRIMTDQGISVFFSLTHACEEMQNPIVEIHGEKGYATWFCFEKIMFHYNNGITEECPIEAQDDARDKIFDHLFAKLADKKAFVCDPGIAGAQTLAINGAHKSCPVVRFVGDRHLYRVPSEESTLTVIEGIEDIVRESFAERKLISEIESAPPWAKPSQEFSLENLRDFTEI